MPDLDALDADALRQELDERPETTPTLRAVCALSYRDGVSVATMSERYGVPESTVYYWLERAERDPAGALFERGRPGRPATLDTDQRESLAATLAEPPTASGFDAAEWSSTLVKRYVEREFGVEFSRTHCWRLLNRYGLGSKNM